MTRSSRARALRAASAIATLAAIGMTAQAGTDATRLTIGGFVKLDAAISEYGGGEPPDGSALRDFHVPGAIPVGGPATDPIFESHAKESRLNVDLTRTQDGHRLGAFVEVDFLLSPSGDERVSNSYTPRLRHAYLEYDRWLFGQTWSTFMIAVLPEDLDFVGVADGTTFRRGPQVRWTRGAWRVAIENPETTATPAGGGARLTDDAGLVPDVVIRHDRSGEDGSLSVAGIVRRLELDTGAGDASATGWGLSAGGRWRPGDDDELVFMLTTGRGLGRHLALNAIDGAAVTTDGRLEPIETTAGFVGLRHAWSDRWRSNVNLAMLDADLDTTISGSDVTRRLSSISANALYSPLPELTLGIEYMHAERELASGADGDLDRLQFSATYAFCVSPTLSPEGRDD